MSHPTPFPFPSLPLPTTEGSDMPSHRRRGSGCCGNENGCCGSHNCRCGCSGVPVGDEKHANTNTGEDYGAPCPCSSSNALNADSEDGMGDGAGGSHSSTLHLYFMVGGMTCASCAQRLTAALQVIHGVASAQVSFLSRQAHVMVRVRENASVAAAVMDCVARLGFTVLGDESPPPSAFSLDPLPHRHDNATPTPHPRHGGRESAGPGSIPHSQTGTMHPPAMLTEGVRATDGATASSSLLVDLVALHHLSSSESDGEGSSDGGEGGGATPRHGKGESLPGLPTNTAAAAQPLTRTTLLIEGMSCGSCAARIEAELLRITGVTEASVNFAVMSGSVLHDARKVRAADLLKAIESLGYTPSLQSSGPLTFPKGRGAAHASRRSGRRARTRSDADNEDKGTAAGISILIDDETPVEGGAHRHPQQEDQSVGSDAKYIHRFLVEGMSCASCAARIERALKALPYVTDCTVSFTTGSAVVVTSRSFSEDNIAVEAAIKDLGYPVTALGRKTSPRSTAKKGGGYDAVAVEVDGHRAAATFLSGSDASRHEEGAEEEENHTSDVARTRAVLERKQEIAKQKSNFINSAILSIPLVIAMLIMALTDVMETSSAMSLIVDAVQMICATPIVFVFGRQFFIGAWRSFRHGAYTMDTLVAIGTGCSYAYSVVAFFASWASGMHVMTYFDTAGMLTSFMLLGRFLEANAKRTTSGALIELMSLVPTMATVITGDGDVRVSTAALSVGDHVRVLAGDRIPVDGTIVEGQSDVDEQLVTGESVPKPCGRGDSVVGGTLNVTATLVVAVAKVGEDTVLSQILKIVQDAQNTKPAVQRVADRVAMYFVPFVVFSSLLTLAAWLVLGFLGAYPAHWRPHRMPAEAFAFNFFIATVVAACPCALGLATPTAIMVGTGVGAQNGVLVKSGVTLEAVRKTTCVVFDKTGTITTGQLKVCAVQSFHIAHGAPLRLVKQLVVAVEEQSTHPVAKAVARDVLGECNENGSADGEREPQMDVLSAVTHAGRGVEAAVAVTETYSRCCGDAVPHGRVPAPFPGGQSVQQYKVLVGSLAFLLEQRVEVSREVADAVQQCHSQGQTTVVAAVDGVVALVVALADQPKREAYGVIAHLHRHNIRTLMVTGDNRLVAASVARAVGISFDNVRAEAMPAEKAAIVKELQADGVKVMFVGDGINDSPALAQADVGVALGAGTEVAIEAADAVLVRNSLVDLLSLRKLSQVTVRRIYGNFGWAFGYNLLMLPLASGLLYPLLQFQLPPVVAGAAMVLSSLSVLTSSLTIRCFKPYRQEDFIEAAWRR